MSFDIGDVNDTDSAAIHRHRGGHYVALHPERPGRVSTIADSHDLLRDEARRAELSSWDKAAVRCNQLGVAFGALTHRHQENRTFAFGVGREEANHVVVVEGEAGGAQSLSVGPQIQFAAKDSSFELNSSIPTIAETLQNGSQVRQKENVHCGVGGQLLLQSEVARLVTEVSLPQTLDHATVAVKDIRTGIEALHCMDDQVDVVK